MASLSLLIGLNQAIITNILFFDSSDLFFLYPNYQILLLAIKLVITIIEKSKKSGVRCFFLLLVKSSKGSDSAAHRHEPHPLFTRLLSKRPCTLEEVRMGGWMRGDRPESKFGASPLLWVSPTNPKTYESSFDVLPLGAAIVILFVFEVCHPTRGRRPVIKNNVEVLKGQLRTSRGASTARLVGFGFFVLFLNL